MANDVTGRVLVVKREQTTVATHRFVRATPDEQDQPRRRPGGTAQVEARLCHKGGSWRVFDAVGRNLLDEPSVGGLLVHARDITEQVLERARRDALLRVARFFALQTGPQRLMRALLAEAVELMGGSFGLVALSGAQAAAATVQQLQRITRLEEIDQAGPGPVLDLARSVQRAS